MKVALAQIRPRRGNIDYNTTIHVSMIKEAASQLADAVFFPELSLSSYEPELAHDLQMSPDDSRLNLFQTLSDQLSITIGLGLPLSVKNGVQIAMAIFCPCKKRQFYSKQYLHQDETSYFIEGFEQLIIDVDGFRIAPAICYESLLPDHLNHAIHLRADWYLASVAKHGKGVEQASAYYAKTSQRHGITIGMVNSLGICDGFESAGGSAFWDKSGMKVAGLNDDKVGIISFEL